MEGGPAGGELRVARPAALGDVWMALEIAELLPAQLQARSLGPSLPPQLQ